MIWRKIVFYAVICLLVLGQIPVVAQAAQGAFTPEQYRKALWMVTRFYGAQRMGEGPNWLLMDHQHKTSYMKDADGAHDLKGGWFDCGDHILFGQTFFYSAYVLAKAYDMFPTGFHDLYHGKDYSDYAESRDWSIAGGKPNGIPDLLEELKYATDYIIKAAPNATTFYSQKGDGTAHQQWVTSGFMSTLPNSNGGEAGGPRPIVKNPNDGVMPSFAASALAIMSRIYRKYDAAYADLCLTHARHAYAYARANRTNSVGAGQYYGSHKTPATVFVTASAEMYKTTGEASFLTDVAFGGEETWNSWHVLDYSNSHDLAVFAAAQALTGEGRQTNLNRLRDSYVTRYAREVNGEKVSTLGGGWGMLRYAGNTAFLAALYSAEIGTVQYDQFIFDQVDFILGNNNANRSFVVGFTEQRRSGQTPTGIKLPHHRNVFLDDRNANDALKAQLPIPERNKYFGYMVGGNRNSNQYVESIQEYTQSEGGVDMNAGLLGALAYIVSKLAPADTSKFGIDVPPPKVPTIIQISTSSNPASAPAFIVDTLRLSVNDTATLYAHVFDQDGAVFTDVICDSVRWMSPNVGDMAVVFNVAGCSLVVRHAIFQSMTVRFSGITNTIAIVNEEDVSVRPRSAAMAKHGYQISVRPNAVAFSVAEGRTITGVSVYNLQGKRVFSRAGGADSRVVWNSAKHPRGMYVVKMSMSNGAVVRQNLLLK